MSMLSRFVLTAIACVSFAGTAHADPGATRLGDTDLRDAKDWDIVRLPPCSSARNTPVTSLGVRVTKHPAEINRLVVTYYNGQKQELNVRERFRPGSASRWIDLSGNARCIQSIRIVGDTNSLGWRPGKQAQVAFWGKNAAGGGAPAPRGGGARASGGGASGAAVGRLGSVRLQDAKDWDRITLPACANSRNQPVNRLKVKVNQHPAEINKLVVTFHNGTRQELSVRKRFAAGSESVWHDLRGNARCISSIRIVGDTQSLGWRPGKQAEVVFLGKAM